MDRALRNKLVTPVQYLRRSSRSGSGVETMYAPENLMCFNYKSHTVTITDLGPVKITNDMLILEYGSKLANLTEEDSFVLEGKTRKVKEINTFRKIGLNDVDFFEVTI